jgi:Gluconate 2-dehydrogenase subunit 3
MKRRRFLKAIAIAPIAVAVPTAGRGQSTVTVPTAAPEQTTPPPATPLNPPLRPIDDVPKIESTVPDAAAEMVPHFFNVGQFAALRKLCDLIMPALDGSPGALDACAPEFLDFLIASSSEERRRLYSAGLDTLNAQGAARFGKPFAEVDAVQADALLAALRQPWTYEPPADPLARFLQAAKQDVRNATMNSREWNVTNAAAAGRRAGGVGQYWYQIE